MLRRTIARSSRTFFQIPITIYFLFLKIPIFLFTFFSHKNIFRSKFQKVLLDDLAMVLINRLSSMIFSVGPILIDFYTFRVSNLPKIVMEIE